MLNTLNTWGLYSRGWGNISCLPRHQSAHYTSTRSNSLVSRLHRRVLLLLQRSCMQCVTGSPWTVSRTSGPSWGLQITTAGLSLDMLALHSHWRCWQRRTLSGIGAQFNARHSQSWSLPYAMRRFLSSRIQSCHIRWWQMHQRMLLEEYWCRIKEIAFDQWPSWVELWNLLSNGTWLIKGSWRQLHTVAYNGSIIWRAVQVGSRW